MTITIVNRYGIWQCADMRLSKPDTGALVDDRSHKTLSATCSDGVMMLSYAGLGSLDGIDISRWLREMIRGENRTVEQTLIFICEEATLHLAPVLQKLNMLHSFCVGAIIRGRPFGIEIKNFDKELKPLSRFQAMGFEVPDNNGMIYAWPHSLTKAEREKANRVATRRTSRPQDVSKLLAKINKRVASEQPTVSEHCIVSWVPASGNGGSTNPYNWPKGLEFGVQPNMLFGIDLTDLMQNMHDDFNKRLADGTFGQPETREQSELVNMIGDQSVKPKNRLEKYRQPKK